MASRSSHQPSVKEVEDNKVQCIGGSLPQGSRHILLSSDDKGDDKDAHVPNARKPYRKFSTPDSDEDERDEAMDGDGLGEDDEGSSHEEEDNILVIKQPAEDEEAELSMAIFSVCVKTTYSSFQECMQAKWRSLIYTFFKPMPLIHYIKGRCIHTFECTAKSCLGTGAQLHYVNCYTDKGDVLSTSNLCKHASKCFGSEALAAADNTRDLKST